MTKLRVVNAGLDEEGEIILRGTLDPETFGVIQVDTYQREILPQSKITALMKALSTSDVPDILLNMRGERITGSDEAGYELADPVYVYDGQQRLRAARKLVEAGLKPRLGCKVVFGHDREWERKQFIILNSTATRVNANVLLKSLAEEVQALEVMYNLCKDPNFVMKDKISWTQYMKRGQLINAATFVKVAQALYSHMAPQGKGTVSRQAILLQKAYDRLGRNLFRNNLKCFFEVVDEIWGIKSVTFKGKATYLKLTFLGSLAQIFSDYKQFWKGDQLFVNRDYKSKLASFPVNDPSVAHVAGAGAHTALFLKRVIIDHINKGRRTGRLVNRYDVAPLPKAVPPAKEEE